MNLTFIRGGEHQKVDADLPPSPFGLRRGNGGRARRSPKGEDRDVAFHRSKPWLFLTLERQGQLEVYRIANGSVDEPALFRKTTLADPGNVRPMQAASAVHLHPNGRFAYVGNRAATA